MSNQLDYSLADGLPVFVAVRVRGKDEMSFVCPQCGKKNTHGCCGTAVGAGDGHRVSHCPCWKHGYYVTEQRPLNQ